MKFDGMCHELEKLTKAFITELSELHPLCELDCTLQYCTAYGASVMAFPHLQHWDFNEPWRMGLLDAMGYMGCNLERELATFTNGCGYPTNTPTCAPMLQRARRPFKLPTSHEITTMATYNKLLPCPNCNVPGESGSHERELTCAECGHSWTSDWLCVIDDDNYGEGADTPTVDGTTCEFADLISPLDDSGTHPNQTATYVKAADMWVDKDGVFYLDEFTHFRIIAPDLAPQS